MPLMEIDRRPAIVTEPVVFTLPVPAAPPASRLAAAWELASANPVLAVIAGIGFAVSFQTIAHLAASQHMPGWPVLYPLLFDTAILGFTIEARKAIDDGRSDLVPRALAWAAAAFTVYVNAHGSPARDWLGMTLHVAAPCMWIAFLELARWRKLRHVRRAAGRDGIPLARWLTAPFSSLVMRRRMIMRNVTSYALAVELDAARLFARDLARAHFGRWRWRRSAPSLLRSRIRSGSLGDDVTTAATAVVRKGVTGGWEETVRLMVTRAITEGDKLAVSVRAERRRIDQQTDGQGDGHDDRQKPSGRRLSATARKRARVTAILKASPTMALSDVAKKAGVSESTVTRIKRETPTPIHGVGG